MSGPAVLVLAPGSLRRCSYCRQGIESYDALKKHEENHRVQIGEADGTGQVGAEKDVGHGTPVQATVLGDAETVHAKDGAGLCRIVDSGQDTLKAEALDDSIVMKAEPDILSSSTAVARLEEESRNREDVLQMASGKSELDNSTYFPFRPIKVENGSVGTLQTVPVLLEVKRSDTCGSQQVTDSCENSFSKRLLQQLQQVRHYDDDDIRIVDVILNDSATATNSSKTESQSSGNENALVPIGLASSDLESLSGLTTDDSEEERMEYEEMVKASLPLAFEQSTETMKAKQENQCPNSLDARSSSSSLSWVEIDDDEIIHADEFIDMEPTDFKSEFQNTSKEIIGSALSLHPPSKGNNDGIAQKIGSCDSTTVGSRNGEPAIQLPAAVLADSVRKYFDSMENRDVSQAPEVRNDRIASAEVDKGCLSDLEGTIEPLTCDGSVSTSRIQITNVNTASTPNNAYEPKVYTCLSCELVFPSKVERARHANQEHAGPTLYPCNLCARSFTQERSLTRHMNLHAKYPNSTRNKATHNSESSDYMEEDETQNVRPAKLRSFSAKVRRPRKSQYQHCLQMSIRETRIFAKTAQPDEDDKFPCPVCPRRLANITSLRIHLRIHSGELPFKCASCKQSFRQLAQCKNHEAKCCTQLFTRKQQSEKQPPVEPCDVEHSHLFQETTSMHESNHCSLKSSQVQPSAHSTLSNVTAAAQRQGIGIIHGNVNSKYSRFDCSKKFPTESLMTQYEATDTGAFKCRYCNRSFKQCYKRRYHENRHTRHKPYKCSNCDQAFFDPTDRGKHSKKCLSAKQTSRPKPAVSLSKEDQHIIEYQCSHCPATFEKFAHQISHERTHSTGGRPALEKWPIDGQKFSSGSDEEQEDKLGNCSSSVKCDFCPLTFAQESLRIKHTATCQGLFATASEFQSAECTSSSAIPVPPVVSTNCVDASQASKKSTSDVKIENDETRAGGKTRERNQAVLRTISKRKRKKNANQGETGMMKCNLCNQFFRSSSFSMHMRFHSQERKFPCQYCSKRFQTMQNVQNHTARLHTREKPHICKTCDMAFLTSGDLCLHRKKCCQVGKINNLHNTESSEARHSIPETPSFPCSICKEVFDLATNLTAHISKEHAEDPMYRCDRCQTGFSELEPYLRHTARQTCRSPRKVAAKLPVTILQQEKSTSAGDDGALRRKRQPNKQFYYHCSSCDAEFTQPAIASAHIKWHTDYRQ